jgi:DNA repair exonuclease SbcCD ATPase subunit
MKQVIIKKLQIENFLSVGGEPVILHFKKGLNVITGKNLDKLDSANGVGKSTVADALFFVLFGQTIRDLKKEFIVNNINKKRCKVFLSFEVIQGNNKDEYVISRTLLPTKCQLYKNGENITLSSMPKTTKFISDLIGCTPEVFSNSVIMTSNNTIPFMGQKKVDKRKFIEGILKLEVFGEMLLAARQDYNDSKREYDIENTRYEEVDNQLKVYESQKAKQTEERKLKIDKLKKREKNNLNEIEQLEKDFNEVKDNQVGALEKNIKLLQAKEIQCSEEIQAKIKEIADIESDIRHAGMQISILKERGDECYACNRPYDPDDIKCHQEEIKKLYNDEEQSADKLALLKADKLNIKATQQKCKDGIEKFKTQLLEIERSENNNKNIQDKINQLADWNRQVSKDIQEIETKKDEFGELIRITTQKFDDLKVEIEGLKNKLSNLDVIKFIVSEEGIKSYIVKKMLKLLNTKLKYYLKELDANCILEFNEYFEETILNDKGQECSYFSFSGGERKRIDLACLFTFMDIRRLQGGVAINILLFDELLDSSLDQKGAELVIDILKDRVDNYNEGVYIISHRSEALKAADNDVIYLEKKNGFTRKVEHAQI